MGPYQLLNITLLQFEVFFKKIIARFFEKEKKIKKMFRRNDQGLYKAKPKVKDFKLRLIFKIVCNYFCCSISHFNF